MGVSNRVLWLASNQKTRNHDNASLSMIETVWMAVLVMLFLAPMILFVIRQFRAWRQGFPSSDRPAATVDAGEFLLRTVMTKQQAEFRQIYLEKHLVVHKVVAPGDGESEGAADNDEESPATKDDSKHTKGDLILRLPTKNEDPDGNNSELNNIDEDNDRPLCAICVAPYQIGEEICSSKNPQCIHIFHKECIQGWLMIHHQCPCCRKPFLVPAKETD